MATPDITIWTGIDLETRDAYAFGSQNEAYDHWRDYGDTTLYTSMNPAEGWCIPLNDEFEEMDGSDRFDARAMARHERSYRVLA